MQTKWVIHLIRALFVLLCAAIGVLIAVSLSASVDRTMVKLTGAGCGIVFSGLVVALEASLRTFTIRHLGNAVIGLLFGLFGAFLVTRVGIFNLPLFRDPQFDPNEFYSKELKAIIEIIAYTGLGFFGLMIALRSERDQFAFIIPYVRFRRDASEGDPMILDTNVIIDGRIPKLHATGFLNGTLVVPRFVLDEMQRLADAHEPGKAERGKRGLHVLEEMRAVRNLDLTIQDDGVTDQTPLETRLLNFAKTLNASLLTNDESLTQVARLRGVTVLNLIELSRALLSEVMVGDRLDIALVKAGKDKHQAVGYMPDGAMIVVNNGAGFIGQTVRVVVSGTTQTTAGRLVFADMTPGAT